MIQVSKGGHCSPSHPHTGKSDSIYGGSIISPSEITHLASYFINTRILEKHSDCRKPKQFRRHYIHIKHLAVNSVFEETKCHTKTPGEQNMLRKIKLFSKLAIRKLRL